MRVRDIIGLILALVLAVGVAFLTRLFLTKQERPGQEVALKTEKVTKVLVAARNLSPGTSIKEGDLTWQEWPKTALVPTDIKEGDAKIEDFRSSIVRFPIQKGSPVSKAELIRKGDKSFLAAVVEPGKRAVSIDVTASATDSGLIFPGDYVDVIVSKVNTVNNMQVGQSKTILKNIKVIAFDTTLAAPEQNPKTPPHVATLEMTPAQADILMAGAKDGTISLSLHSIENEEVEPTVERPAPKPEDKKIILMRGRDKSEIEFRE